MDAGNTWEYGNRTGCPNNLAELIDVRVTAWWHQHDLNPRYLVILVIVLVLFGGSKLPDLANSLGRSMKEFKKGIGAEPEAEQAPTP